MLTLSSEEDGRCVGGHRRNRIPAELQTVVNCNIYSGPISLRIANSVPRANLFDFTRSKCKADSELSILEGTLPSYNSDERRARSFAQNLSSVMIDSVSIRLRSKQFADR